MKPFYLYSEIEPALGRADVFLATTTFSADEPHRDLLLFPEVDRGRIFMVSRLHHVLRCEHVPRLSNMGEHEGRYFYALGLGPARTAPRLSTLRSPVPAPFWEKLRRALQELHQQHILHTRLVPQALAVTDQGAPLVFDLLAARWSESAWGEADERLDWDGLDALKKALA